jgi:hypothetical protein
MCGMPAPPSLEVLSAVASGELDAQARRGDALDSKAGVVLGFAGVLVGLTAPHITNALAEAGFASAAASAVLALIAFTPRPFPALDPYRLRARYLAESEGHTKERLMDTRITIYRHLEPTIRRKLRLVTGATTMLALSVVLTAFGATL